MVKVLDKLRGGRKSAFSFYLKYLCLLVIALRRQQIRGSRNNLLPFVERRGKGRYSLKSHFRFSSIFLRKPLLKFVEPLKLGISEGYS